MQPSNPFLSQDVPRSTHPDRGALGRVRTVQRAGRPRLHARPHGRTCPGRRPGHLVFGTCRNGHAILLLPAHRGETEPVRPLPGAAVAVRSPVKSSWAGADTPRIRGPLLPAGALFRTRSATAPAQRNPYGSPMRRSERPRPEGCHAGTRPMTSPRSAHSHTRTRPSQPPACMRTAPEPAYGTL